MKHYEKLQQLIAELQADATKFYEGNNAAGTRVRKALQEIKKSANDMRADVQSVREGRK